MITVVDYGVGNLGSITNMLRKIGAPAQLASTPAALEHAEKLLLPGVGAFDTGMRTLNERGFGDPLRSAVLQRRVPLLGICLGMQMLAKGSEEGVEPGLGFIDGRCVRFAFPPGEPLKVPHMGWNVIEARKQSALLEKLDAEPRFYFVHSYHMVCSDPADVLATARYGYDFTAIVQRDNIIGAQFHPEKSHRFGMALLKSFAELPIA